MLIVWQGCQGNKHGGMHCTGLVEHHANDLLYMIVASNIFCSMVGLWHKPLYFGAIGGALPGMW